MASRSPSTKSHSSRKRQSQTRSSPSSIPVKSINDEAQTTEEPNSVLPSVILSPGENDIQMDVLQCKPLPNIEPGIDEPRTGGHLPFYQLHEVSPLPANDATRGATEQSATTPTAHYSIPLQNGDQGYGATDNSISKKESVDHVDEVHRVQLEPERTGWARLYDLVRQFDKDRVEDVKEDIDTLLVFAGLFSAVVTAFIIETYKNLQSQPDDTSTQVLLHISAQLASLSLNGNFINSTIPSFTPTPFLTLGSTVLVNTLWVSSLIIALITASLGILVKQWFHELLAYETHNPQERLKLRFFRERGLERWRVFAIASSLPLLLQLALLLFLIGLAAFLHSLNPVVGWITTGIMIAWLAVFIFTTLAPTFSSQCPYKVPMLKGLLTQLRSFLVSLATLVHPLIKFVLLKVPNTWIFLRNLHHRSEKWPNKLKNQEEDQICKRGSLSMPILVCAKDLLHGERLNDTIRECFGTISAEDMKSTSQESIEKQGPVYHGLIPDVSQGMPNGMVSFILNILEERSISIYFDEGPNMACLSPLYSCLALALSGIYDPAIDRSIPRTHLPTFIRLIQKGPTSAAFSILAMYSIHHHTLQKYPATYNQPFWWLTYTEMKEYGIGDQFVLNLIAATRALVDSLWDKTEPESDIKKIVNCITQIKQNARWSGFAIPLDPVPLLDVFSTILWGLIPEPVIERHHATICEVNDELVELLKDLGETSWTYSHKQCVGWTITHLDNRGFGGQLVTELRRLIQI
ncbi:hypothetical protein QCA50_012364 [Cerrena zonata]|uniref:DUF6535 domain-containing protein n=1 Tax=Cerrena zonata TaxID=2478898 RepID=A0AAW0G4C3_9APHY